jgi:hypothetical protein
MRYFRGDVVEIITAKYKSWNDIPLHEIGYYEQSNGGIAPMIGQRFRVKSHDGNHVYGGFYSSIGKHSSFYQHNDTVMLYNRPFLNWVKALFCFLIKAQ